MSKRYMDFAPKKATGGAAPAARPAGRAISDVRRPAKGVTTGAKKPVAGAKRVVTGARPAKQVETKAKRTTTKMEQGASVAVKTTVSFSAQKEPRLGVIEDLSPKFVNTNVPKRPLSQAPHFNVQKTGVAAAKAEKVGNRGAATTKKTANDSKKTGVSGTYSMPKSPFINQAKVQKRPLSRNVYQKQVPTPKEEPKGPVTIISKPEKQTNVGLIVTVILTIILGAAAGTVAFLLLPK